jgi:hypothetical protein
MVMGGSIRKRTSSRQTDNTLDQLDEINDWLQAARSRLKCVVATGKLRDDIKRLCNALDVVMGCLVTTADFEVIEGIRDALRGE